MVRWFECTESLSVVRKQHFRGSTLHHRAPHYVLFVLSEPSKEGSLAVEIAEIGQLCGFDWLHQQMIYCGYCGMLAEERTNTPSDKNLGIGLILL